MFGRSAAEEQAIGSTLRASDPAVRWLLFGVFVNQLGAFVQIFLVLFLVDNGVGEGRAGLALGAYGAGSVLGALLGVLAFDAIGSGVWAVCAGIGALAALAAFAGMCDPAPARARSLSPSPATTGASS